MPNNKSCVCNLDLQSSGPNHILQHQELALFLFYCDLFIHVNCVYPCFPSWSLCICSLPRLFGAFMHCSTFQFWRCQTQRCNCKIKLYVVQILSTSAYFCLSLQSLCKIVNMVTYYMQLNTYNHQTLCSHMDIPFVACVMQWKWPFSESPPCIASSKAHWTTERSKSPGRTVIKLVLRLYIFDWACKRTIGVSTAGVQDITSNPFQPSKHLCAITYMTEILSSDAKLIKGIFS